MTIAFAVDSLPSYVVGYPIHVALTVSVDEPETGVVPLSLDPRGVRMSLLHLATGKEMTVAARPVQSHRESESGPDRVVLDPGKSARFLIDLSTVWPASMEPGRVRVALVNDQGWGEVAVPPFVVDRVPPTPEQAARLADVLPELRGGWATWPMSGEPTKYPLTPRKDDPARYYVVLRSFYGFPGSIRNANLGLIDVLDGFYAPDAALLRAEMAIVRHDKAGFRASASFVRGLHKSSSWVIERLERTGSGIAFFHALLHEEDPEPLLPGAW
jgi:hypothetical protein